MPSDEDLLERTLAYSGTYVSDDGHLAIRRSTAARFEYGGTPFVGYCVRCAHDGLMTSDGEPLPDLRAAVRFASTHDHGAAD